ncbi:MFS transporter [Streptomyces sp. NPDC090306]|uniref:MFS transporter n=1 Tax=Streptomyces sp. NPDC090306 TaxID=3365961 RepID=UPI003829D4BA
MTNPPSNPPSTPSSAAPNSLAGRREWTALCVLMLPLLLVSMDVSVLYFAIPAITADLEPSSTQQLWIFDMYGFVLAGLLLTMGSLADRIGRRRLLLAGAAAFGLASVAAAYAQTPGQLIAARAVLGVGGATLMPSTMALVRQMFRDARQRAKAVAVWSGVMTGGVALGSVLSGVLVENFWWGSVFLVNLPAMLMLLVLGPILLPESRDPAPGRFDLLGVPLSLAAVLPVIWGLKEIAAHGAHPGYVASLTVGLLFAALFVRRQRTAAVPMIPPSLFRARGFGAAAGLNLVAAFAMMGSAYFTTQYLQSVLGKSPLSAALWSLVPSVVIGAAAPLAASLVARGVRRPVVVAGGFTVSAAGFALLVPAGTDSLWLVLAGAGVLAAGIVVVMSQITDLALSTAPPERAGTASAVLETGQEFGGALGMAVLGSVGTAVFRGGMPDGAPGPARETLGGALAVARALPARAGAELTATARTAFTHGMTVAAVCAGALLLAAAVAALLMLRGATGGPEGGGEDAGGAGAADLPGRRAEPGTRPAPANAVRAQAG